MLDRCVRISTWALRRTHARTSTPASSRRSPPQRPTAGSSGPKVEPTERDDQRARMQADPVERRRHYWRAAFSSRFFFQYAVIRFEISARSAGVLVPARSRGLLLARRSLRSLRAPRCFCLPPPRSRARRSTCRTPARRVERLLQGIDIFPELVQKSRYLSLSGCHAVGNGLRDPLGELIHVGGSVRGASYECQTVRRDLPPRRRSQEDGR